MERPYGSVVTPPVIVAHGIVIACITITTVRVHQMSTHSTSEKSIVKGTVIPCLLVVAICISLGGGSSQVSPESGTVY